MTRLSLTGTLTAAARFAGGVCAIACGGALLCAPARAAAQEPVRLEVAAGVGGVARAGRWMPVRVTIDDMAADVAGELVVEWGDARLHRDLSLAAPSRTSIELYVRTPDPRGMVTVRIVDGGQTLVTTDAPVRVASADEVVAICVGATSSSIAPSTEVPSIAAARTVPPETARRTSPADTVPCLGVAAAALPRSMRGYDAVDAVVAAAGRESALTAEQRIALRRWRAYHDLEATRLLSVAPRLPWDAASARVGPARPLRVGVAVYLLALVAAGGLWLLRPDHVRWPYGALAFVAVAGIPAVIYSGHAGSWSPVVVRHATTVQQVDGGSLVTMRGEIEYPAFDQFAVRAAVADGALQSKFISGSEQWTEESGTPVRRGTFGSGGREEVELEAVLDFAPLQVSSRDGLARVSNISAAPLDDCRFPDGFSRLAVGTLAPGGSAEARQLGAVEAPFFVCSAGESPVRFTDPNFAVRSEGRSLLSVRLPLGDGAGAAR